jgi:hypothetical protein
MDTPKRAVQSKVKVGSIPSKHHQRYQDARWAQHDAEVQSRYRGEFVVPYLGKIVAHGTDAAAILAEAARLTGLKPQDLPLVGIINPLEDIPY